MKFPMHSSLTKQLALSGLVGAICAFALRAETLPTAPSAAQPAIVATTEILGSIDPGSGAHLLEAIEEAREMGAEALIVRLDTPGGLLSTTHDLVQAELSSKVPIVFWVGPPGARAGSAGVFLTLAAHVAAMAPSTNIGAAHPVGAGGSGKRAKRSAGDAGPGATQEEDSQKSEAGDDDVMASKIENDTAAFVRGIAERRSRNIEWAEQAVRESVSITATEALNRKVIDLIAEDIPELLQKLDGRVIDLGGPGGADKKTLHTLGAQLRPLDWSIKNRAVHFLGDPEIAYLIGMLGVLGILAEMYHPGTIIPGVVGVACLVIAGIGFQMVPISGGALALIGVGIALLAAELYAGGHGGFIVAGIVCIVIGSLLLVGHVGNGFYADRDFGIGWREVGPIAASLAVIAWTLVYKVSRTARGKLVAGANVLLGQIGVVSEALALGANQTGPLYEGSLLVNGELWKARATAPMAAGTKAKVLAIQNLSVLVELV
jgi:membrane-bound serine protease (ClpP class)